MNLGESATAEDTTPAWDRPSVVHSRPRTWVSFGLSGFLFVVAVAAHTPVPLFAAVPLLLAPVAALLLAPAGDEPCVLTWNESGEATEVLVTGEIAPPPSVDPRDVDFQLTIPPGLLPTRATEVTRTGRTIRFVLRLHAREPVLAQISPPMLRWRDALGLMERSLPLEGTPIPIERAPLETGRLGTVRLHRTIVLPGETRSRAIGECGDFYGVRLMVPGDSPRRINWAATARGNATFTNEFSLERTGDLLLLLDARPTELGRFLDSRLLGVARAATFAIADGFLHERARVGLAVFGEFLTPVKLGGGRRQRYRIREALLAAEVAPVAAPAERAGYAARRFFPPGITTVIVSSLADESTRQLVVHLRRRGYPSIVLSPSPVAANTINPLLSGEERALALRLVELVRRHEIAEVWSDAPVVDWRDFWSLAGFSAFMKQGLRNRRTG